MTTIRDVAERAGQTPHAFMLEAIAERVTAEEQRSAFREIVQAYGCPTRVAIPYRDSPPLRCVPPPYPD